MVRQPVCQHQVGIDGSGSVHLSGLAGFPIPVGGSLEVPEEAVAVGGDVAHDGPHRALDIRPVACVLPASGERADDGEGSLRILPESNHVAARVHRGQHRIPCCHLKIRHDVVSQQLVCWQFPKNRVCTDRLGTRCSGQALGDARRASHSSWRPVCRRPYCSN